MEQRRGISLPVASLLFSMLVVSFAQGEEKNGSERAVVKPDSLEVHAKAAAGSKIRKKLGRGDTVIVDAEVMDSSGVAWCGVREEGEERVTGFVLCEGLERKEPAIREKWRPLPYREESEKNGSQPEVAPPPAEPPKAPEQPATPPATPPAAPPEIVVPRGY